MSFDDELDAQLSALRQEGCDAPEHVERAVLERYRAAQNHVPAVAAYRTVTVRERTLQPRMRWMAAVAALVLIGFVSRFVALKRVADSGRESNKSLFAPFPRIHPGSEAKLATQHTPMRAVGRPALSVRSASMRSLRHPSRPPRLRREPAEIQEVATDFIPLSFSQVLPQAERGEIIRVSMPRSTLASFGLPVNAARSFEQIHADVVLGEDGLARAIRFVQ